MEYPSQSVLVFPEIPKDAETVLFEYEFTAGTSAKIWCKGAQEGDQVELTAPSGTVVLPTGQWHKWILEAPNTTRVVVRPKL